MKNIVIFLRGLIRRTTPQEAVIFELAESEMALLKAETGVEWAQATVTYNKNRIKRLKAYLGKTEEPT
jgi:hypothetical protein